MSKWGSCEGSKSADQVNRSEVCVLLVPRNELI